MNHRALIMLTLVLAGESVFLLPFVLARVFRPTLLDVFGLTNFELGAAFSLYGVIAMLAYFPGGPLADRFSARRLMSAALVSTAAGGLLYATIPDLSTITLLFGWWGVTTILLFWAALLRATRAWGDANTQGRAYGLLDAGRGLVAAGMSTLSVALFAMLATDDSLATRTEALQAVILFYSAFTAAVAGLVWWAVPEPPPSQRESITTAGILATLKRPSLWLQAFIVVCAYVGYKGTDDFSLLARDALGYSDVDAASLGTLSLWIRPPAALAAGLLADRFRGSHVLMATFATLVVCDLAIVFSAGSGIALLLLSAIVGTSAAVFALRGVYFAVFDESHVPRAYTGTAVGVVSVLGYTPDIFMGPLMGQLLDSSPGVLGHQHLFATLAGFALLGLGASWAFERVTRVYSPAET